MPPTRATKARALIHCAAELGAPGFVLYPPHLGGDVWEDAHLRLCAVLAALKRLFGNGGNKGDVEGLGYAECDDLQVGASCRDIRQDPRL
jgi:predicted xylose isomerase-like sugar epimerase